MTHPTTVKGAVFAEFDRATRPREGGGDGEDRLVGSVDLAPLMKSRVYSRPKRPLPPAGPPTPDVGGSGLNDPKVTA